MWCEEGDTRKNKEPSNSGVLKEKIERVIEEGTFKKSKEEIKNT